MHYTPQGLRNHSASIALGVSKTPPQDANGDAIELQDVLGLDGFSRKGHDASTAAVLGGAVQGCKLDPNLKASGLIFST